MKDEQLNFPAQIAKSFVSNKALSWLLFFAAVIAGVFGYMAAPKRYNPDIDQARFIISQEYPGASAEEVENFVVKNYEQELTDLEDVDDIMSTSIDGGLGTIFVTFEVGVDVDRKRAEVLTKIDAVKNKTRQLNLPDPVITSVLENETILSVGFKSEELTVNELREQVFKIRNAIREVPGVANLQILGGEGRALRVELDPGKMKNRNIGANDIIKALKDSNIKAGVGDIKNGEWLSDIEVEGYLISAEEVEGILVGPGVKLNDIAYVREDYIEENSKVLVYEDGRLRGAVFLSLGQVGGTNITDVVDDVFLRLEHEMGREEYANLEYTVYRDDGTKARRETNSLVVNLIQSITIVFLVLLVFLQFRPALNVAVAIPTTLLITIFIGYSLGEDISKVTLFALILALGLLVDSATVVVENVYRHINEGEKKFAAIITAVKEVGVGLLMSAITSIIVFVPLQMVGDVMGAYIKPMGVLVPIALAVSTILAFTITPFMSFILLKSPTKEEIDKEKAKPPGFIDKVSNKYAEKLEWLLNKKPRQYIFLFSIFISLCFGIWLFQNDFVRQRSFPDTEPEEYSIYVDAPEGADLDRTEEIAEYVAREAGADPRAESVELFIGTRPVMDNGGSVRGAFGRDNPYQASLRIKVIDPEDLPKELKFKENIVNTLRHDFDNNEIIQKYLSENISIRIMENPDSIPYEAPMVVKVKGPNRELREKVARDIEEIIKRVPNTVHTHNFIENAYSKFIYRVDHDKAMRSGVAASDVKDALKITLGPERVGQYRLEGVEEAAFIELSVAKEERNELADLEQVYIKSSLEEMVPLASVAERIETRQDPKRTRDDLQPMTKVISFLSGTSIIYAMRDLNNLIENEYEFPEGGKMVEKDNYGFSYEMPNGENYRLDYGGEWEQSQDINADLSVAIGLAFLLVYAVLVYQFSSFIVPLIVMSTIPLGFIGIFPGFALLWFIAKIYMSSTAIIGFIALMGIVVNNSIMLIEYFDMLRKEGLEIQEALVKAGKVRLRPIMLTSITTILGTVLIAFDPTWAGLAWSIVFGLAISAGITVFMIPVLYNLIKPKRAD